VSARQSALILVAHPDDAELAMAMRMAQMARAGISVDVHCFTKGSARQAEERVIECLAARAVLGIQGYTFSDLPENHLSASLSEVNDITYALMQRLRPALLFTHFPNDQHPDHVAVGTAATFVAKREVPHIEHFRSPYSEGFQPNRIILADENLWQLKREALACFASQAQLPITALEAATRFSHYSYLHHRVIAEFGEPRYGEQFSIVRDVQSVSLGECRG
jgi:N-acetylglucosamine malate deacetylase 1